MVGDALPRRLAAILHLDVVEFSRLTHDNEDATYRTLQNYLRDMDTVIENRGGRTVDRSGDNLLAVFPVAADSVMAAVNIQERLTTKNGALPADRQIHARIGINLGDIIDDGQRVFGDGVNVAARLQEIAPPGGICISDSARIVIGNALSVSFQAVGEQQLRNIASKISAHLVISDSDQPRKSTHEPDDPRLSIAVLPFTSQTGNSDLAGLGMGLTVDLISALSRFRQLFVIAQHTSLAQKRDSAGTIALGRQLGTRYLVDGSIRTAGKGFRVAVQLIDAVSGGYLWSESYDGGNQELLSIQDEITQRVASTLVSNLEHSAARRADTRRTDADYTDVIRARQLVYRMQEPRDTEMARTLFHKVIGIDPQFAPALSGLALTHLTDLLMSWSPEPDTCVPRATQYAQQSLELDYTDSLAHAVYGITGLWRGQHIEAVSHLEQALELNPNHADAFAGMGLALIFTGDPVASIRQIGLAFERNPFPPSWYRWALAIAQYNSARYHEAVQTLQAMPDLNRFHRRVLSASYARLGDLDSARTQREIVMAETPGYTAADSRLHQPYANPAHIQPFIDGLVLAGFPAGDPS